MKKAFCFGEDRKKMMRYKIRKMFLLALLLLINIGAWGQTAASFSVTSVEIGYTTLTDRTWVSEIANFVSGINEIARILNTGAFMYRVDRLNSLEEQLLQRAEAALHNETIRRGETWQVILNQTPQGARGYTFYFHRESNGELYFLLYRTDRR
ncbi:MAG: hypothetical protein FWD87_05360 [Spirochaetaceae bacterium]|nr:hypothetical protein [Spirochaetaceae bacterium]